MNARGERILIFGDSLTHHGADAGPEVWDVNQGSMRSSSAPGDILASLLAEQGATVRTNARVGRSAWNFWNRESANQLITGDLAWQPTKVIVMLGTNDVGLDISKDMQAMTAIRDAYAQSGAEVWAVGPFVSSQPATQIELVAQMMSNVFGYKFIDGRPFGEFAQHSGDGVHYTQAGARTLALALVDAIMSRPSPSTIWKGAALGAVGLLGALGVGLLWRRHARGHSLFGDVEEMPEHSEPLEGAIEIVDGKRFEGDPARKGFTQIPCKSDLDQRGLARCWTRKVINLGDAGIELAGDEGGYRVAYGLVTKRDGKIVTVRSIVDAPRALTREEAEKWRRQYGKSATAWVETMDGTHVPVKGAMRPGKFVGDVKPGEVHATLHREPLKGADDDDFPAEGEDDEKWWERINSKAKAAREPMRKALAANDAVIVTSGTRKILLLKTPEMSNKDEGSIRVTAFDEDGPIGHTTRESLDKIADEMHGDWGSKELRPATEAEVIEWTGTERFAKGSAAVAHVQRKNAGLEGDARSVDPRKLFAWQPKVRETLVDIEQGRTSRSGDQPLVVSRLDSPCGAFWVIDGHHRAVEAIQRGDAKVQVVVSDDVPRIERTGGAYVNVLADKISLSTIKR